MKLPLHQKMSAELQQRTCMATWGLNIRSPGRPQVDLKCLHYSEKRNGVMRSHLRQMSWYFSQILLYFYMRDPKRINITITGASEWSEYRDIWSRDATAPANVPAKPTERPTEHHTEARLARSKLKGTGYSWLQLQYLLSWLHQTDAADLNFSGMQLLPSSCIRQACPRDE